MPRSSAVLLITTPSNLKSKPSKTQMLEILISGNFKIVQSWHKNFVKSTLFRIRCFPGCVYDLAPLSLLQGQVCFRNGIHSPCRQQ